MIVVTDSSVMYSVEEGEKHGLTVVPLSVSLGGDTWLEYEDISAPAFLELVRAGGIPTSSSPPPAYILDAYDTDEEVLHITMADGLSGAYEVACGLKDQAPHPDRIHILNSRTLCVPHRILAAYALALSDRGFSLAQVIEGLTPLMDSAHSYLFPEDFDFLRRGGRLTPLAAKIASLLKAVPVMEQTDDGTRLERFTVARQLGKALDVIIDDMDKRGVTDRYYVGVSHADNLAHATEALNKVLERFPRCRHGIFELGPAFITQGGPGCVAIQIVDLSTCPDLEIGC